MWLSTIRYKSQSIEILTDFAGQTIKKNYKKSQSNI